MFGGILAIGMANVVGSSKGDWLVLSRFADGSKEELGEPLSIVLFNVPLTYLDHKECCRVSRY